MTKRDFLKHLPLAAGSVALSACAGSALMPQYLISNDMILRELLPYFPFNRSVNGIGSVSLTKPSLSFAPDINKVRLGMGLNLGLGQSLMQMTGLNLGNTIQQGTCQVACGLRYDRQTRGIYLKEPVVESLQLSGIASNYTNQARSLINNLAPQVLDRYAIHTLEPSLATRFLGSMSVQNNGISLGFGL